MNANLKQLKKEALTYLVGITTISALEDFRIKYFGRKNGTLSNILKKIKDLKEDERKIIGKEANLLKKFLEDSIAFKMKEIEDKGMVSILEKEKIDVTTPGVKINKGHIHPLTQLIGQAIDIFASMGFEVAYGPEVETEFYNFDALNIAKDHPARDMQDTFWLDVPGLLMRTHTSSVQIHYMQNNKPPIRMIAPGRVFRNEATDATHELQFYQIEGLMIGSDISLANLKAILEVLFRQLLDNKKLKVRFRPSYFPFVKPGVEYDVTCFKCLGKKCALCKHTGWIEIGGAGMVHKKVLHIVKIDTTKWQGFAFGIGFDRLVMMRHNIENVRLLYNGDMRFLKQF